MQDTITHIGHDLHIHTYLSTCCEDKVHQTPNQIIQRAKRLGLERIGFSDHLWQNPHLRASSWYQPQNETRIVRLRQELASITTDMRILVGCEADTVAPGRFSITKDFAETLDFTLLSCSHLHLKDIVEQPPNDTPKVIAAHLVKFFLSGVKSGLATIMAHPFVPYGFINMFDGIIAALSDSELFDAFCLAEESGVGIEITAVFLPHVILRRVSRDNPSLVEPLFSIETPIRLLSIAKQAGCKFTFGSDAHDPAGQRELPGIIELIKSVDIKRDDLIPMLLER